MKVDPHDQSLLKNKEIMSLLKNKEIMSTLKAVLKYGSFPRDLEVWKSGKMCWSRKANKTFVVSTLELMLWKHMKVDHYCCQNIVRTAKVFNTCNIIVFNMIERMLSYLASIWFSLLECQIIFQWFLTNNYSVDTFHFLSS